MLSKKSLAVAGVLLAVAAGLGFTWLCHGSPRELKLPGVVETQQVRLSSKVGGRVAKVVVAEGELVEAGQPLVYIDVPELHAQKAQQEARRQAAYADLERIRNGARSEEKAAAHSAWKAAEARHDRLKAGPRSEEIADARHKVDSVRAELDRSEQDLRRLSALYKDTTVARAELDEVIARNKRLQGELGSAQARLDMLLAGTRPEELAEAQAEAARTKAQYDLLEAGSRREDIVAAEAKLAEIEARLRETDIQLAEAVVRAPEKALVEVLPVRPGDVVAAGQPVARVLRADDMWVKVFVPETELGKLRLNDTVAVTVDSYPGRRFSGKVTHIAGVSEFTPRNVQSVSERRHQVFAVKVRVADPQGVFRSGMAAEVLLPLHD